MATITFCANCHRCTPYEGVWRGDVRQQIVRMAARLDTQNFLLGQRQKASEIGALPIEAT